MPDSESIHHSITERHLKNPQEMTNSQQSIESLGQEEIIVAVDEIVPEIVLQAKPRPDAWPGRNMICCRGRLVSGPRNRIYPSLML
jgi:hypothetical protein